MLMTKNNVPFIALKTSGTPQQTIPDNIAEKIEILDRNGFIDVDFDIEFHGMSKLRRNGQKPSLDRLVARTLTSIGHPGNRATANITTMPTCGNLEAKLFSDPRS